MTWVIDTFRREIVCTPILFLFTAFSFPVSSEDSVFEEIGIPEGFELLAAPQLTEVDIYYGGRYLQSVRATYTPTTLQFSNVEDVIQLIPGMTNSELIRKSLSGPLDRHDEFNCQPNTECATYAPDVAGIVFDESRFRVQLAINSGFLEPPKDFAGRYLPLSTADNSFLQTMNVLFSGASTKSNSSNENSNDTSNTWTFFGRSMLSVKEKNLETLWDYDKEQHLGFRSLSLNEDREGFSYGVGLIQSRGFGLTFTQDQSVVGARVGSSQRTLLENGITQSTRLQVFRANRGRVEIFRNGRLIHTEFQEAGNQLINTQAFPSGAYEITIRLYDGDILSQEETRFFVKTTYLPPADEPQYFVELGKPVNMQSSGPWPLRQEGMLARGGYNWRAGETASLAFATATTGKEVLGEFSGLKLGERYQIGSSIMVADRQRYGASAFSFVNLGWASMNFNYQKLWSDPIKVGPIEEDYQLLGDGFSQGAVSLGIPIGKGNFDLRRSYHKDDGKPSKIIDGVAFDYPLWKQNDYELRFRTDLSKDNDSLRVLAGIELRQRLKQWYNRVGYQNEYHREEQGATTDTSHDNHYRVATTWYDRDTFADDIEIDGFAEKQNKRSTLSAGVRYTGRYFDSSTHVNRVNVDGQSTVNSYSGGISASLITNGDTVAFGGEGHTESGLLVKLNGQVKGEFDILVNGQRRGYGSVGNSTLINLPSFESYKVFIRPRGESYYEYDERELEFTLYPGNVQSFSWDVEQVLVVIGQLQDINGNPIANASLDGVTGVADTDSEGLFQARINTGIRNLGADLSDGKRCLFSLPAQYSIRRGVVLAGSLECK